jgi:hypothetical protein
MHLKYLKVIAVWKLSLHVTLNDEKMYSIPLGRDVEIGDIVAVNEDGQIDFAATPVPATDMEFPVLNVTKFGLIRAVEDNRDWIVEPDVVIEKIKNLTQKQMEYIADKLKAIYLREYDFYTDLPEILNEGHIEVKTK